MEAQVLPSRRDTLGGRGVRALYICIQLYIDELSPANPLIPDASSLLIQRSEAAGCCRAGSGAAGCCRAICGVSTGAARGCCPGSGVSGGCRVASGWAGQRCLPTPQRSGAAGCCRAGSGAAGCCRFFCGAGTGAARGCCPGSGVSGTGPGSGTGQFRSPPRRGAAPLPPSVGGQGGCRSAAVRHGGAGQRVGQTVRGAPRSAGMRQPVCRPAGGGGGLLSLGFTRQVQSSGGGGRPTPRGRTCICGRGWGSAQPKIWAGTLLRGSHIGRRPRSFRRAAIRWGGRGGGG